MATIKGEIITKTARMKSGMVFMGTCCNANANNGIHKIANDHITIIMIENILRTVSNCNSRSWFTFELKSGPTTNNTRT